MAITSANGDNAGSIASNGTPPIGTLDQVLEVPGLGSRLLNLLPLLSRLRLRGVSRSLKSAVDESLATVASINADDLAGAGLFAGHAAAWLFRMCPNLVSFSVTSPTSGTDGSDDPPWSAAPGTTAPVESPRVQLDDSSLQSIIYCGSSLRHLDLQGCQGVTDRGLSLLARHCPALESVIVSDCPKLTCKSLRLLGPHCTRLRHLAARRCVSVADDCISVIVSHCPALESLDLGHTRVTDRGILALATSPCHRQLSHLTVDYCAGVTDASIRALADRCAGIRHLNVSLCHRVSDASILHIARSCPRLEHLDARLCANITDVSLIPLAESCPRLSALYLSMTPITDTLLIALSQHSLGLTRIDLGHCPSVTDAGIAALAVGCPELRLLDIHECHLVSDASIEAVSAGCPSLRQLVAWGTQVTDTGIVAVAGRCGGLRQLSVAKCSGVTDVGISAIAQGCPWLEWLSVQDCPGVTDDGVLWVAQMCSGLRHLSVLNCKRVTSRSIEMVRQQCRRLREEELLLWGSGVSDLALVRYLSAPHHG